LIQKHTSQYTNINNEFAEIISKSLESENLQVHAKAASFLDDFQQWIDLLLDRYEVVLYKEAVSEYRSMLLFL
jgi:TusA-related sulfurtransferase